MVRKVDSGHLNGLQEGDVILTLNNKLITRVSDLDIMYNNEELDGVIVRKRVEMRIKVPTVATEDLETDRCVIFCGAMLHRPHHAVRQQISKVHSDIYVSGRVSLQSPLNIKNEPSHSRIYAVPTNTRPQMRGSPAYAYGLAPTNFLTHVNGVPTPDLTAFLQEVTKIPDNTYFRLKVMTFDNVPWVATMKKNEHYHPTVEFVKDPSVPETGWRRIMHECDESGATECLGEDLEPADDVNVVEEPAAERMS